MAVPTESRVREDELIVGAGLLAGGANVIMQLARPGVGYGVVESEVDSGNIFKHPIKRTRTTLTYLAVASMGTDEERALFRRATNRSHARVRSTESSPVSYNAFDKNLQLWVAACLYRGVEDVYTMLVGGLTDAEIDELYQRSATLGTTLQVTDDMWPADRAEFERYWNDALEQVHVDDTVRRYLHQIAVLGFMPRYVSAPLGGFNKFLTTGFLPQRFRDEMRLPWSDRDQRRFDRLMRAMGTVIRRLPPVLRQFPFNYFLWDVRRRIKAGSPLV
ncbi:oxygenase MpaB family protein [Saccharopolyspora sp. NFXS83]|uniref:oxygenase MpaB family protein n=1 Tax=Saccharopolyspora sp. NFXS83 TaxID=2993560 RepID=UPI00224B1552|nr:oxygenase MpaB family protein [Saccharopolyspora sp. NFXS83]MCX2734230.1 oxygenase MpaB family protein [Saccharopolyspora sp. NFXS83]